MLVVASLNADWKSVERNETIVFDRVCFWAAATWPAQAQDAIYRCGNEYTNTKPDAKARGCKLIDAGNVTVVQSARVPEAANSRAAGSLLPGGQRHRPVE